MHGCFSGTSTGWKSCGRGWGEGEVGWGGRGGRLVGLSIFIPQLGLLEVTGSHILTSGNGCMGLGRKGRCRMAVESRQAKRGKEQERDVLGGWVGNGLVY